MNLQPYSSRVLALCGLILIGIGLYFVLLRPALLPEDTRYIGRSLEEIRVAVPGLLTATTKGSAGVAQEALPTNPGCC